MLERKTWIDLLRGICMLAILLDHTELYYTGGNIIDYNFYVVNALVVFFFLSGYLFFKNEAFSLQRKLKSVGQSIIMPYFIFTTVIAVPKALVHGHNISDTLMTIVTGEASWFVAALAVSEIVFAILLWITKSKTWILSTVAITSLIICTLLPSYTDTYWQLENACFALPILYSGYLYHQYEKVFNRFNTPSSISFLFILLVIIKVYEYKHGINLLIEPIAVNNWVTFIIDSIIATLFLVSLAKQLPTNRPIEWIGAHSIVYYFMSGGIPLLVAKALQKANLPYQGQYHRVVIAFLLVCFFASIVTWLIYRYIPFITGRKPTARKIN